MYHLIADLADHNQTLEALQGDSQEAGITLETSPGGEVSFL